MLRARSGHGFIGVLLLIGSSCVPVPGPKDGCPLDATERQLATEVISELLRNALFVVDETNDVEQAQALSLVGVDQSYITVAFLVGECEGPQEFDPYCSSDELPPPEGEEPFYDTRFQCGQLGCEAVNIRFSTVYFTMQPITDSGEEHEFSYSTASPPGTAVYDPNPLITWRVDRTDPTRIAFSAEFDFQVQVTPTGETSIDLSHAGSFEAIQQDEEITSLSLDVSFPSLGTGESLTAELSLTSPEEISGILQAGNVPLATISMQRGGDIEFVWVDAACQIDKPACRGLSGLVSAHCP